VERIQRYRDLTAQCVLIASESNRPEHRAALLAMAQRWRELADHAERTETSQRDDK
jgi:hypothetical protein